mmetsp:Transcript_24607/g.58413  ORF Transcript_24607/g.58413 Transcript_24607/m.58413 type:complete len:269 (+) Transcript_24607:460-1266(+)
MMQCLSSVRGIDPCRIRRRLQKDLHHRRSIAGRGLLKRLCVRLLDGLNCRVVHQLLAGHKQRLLLLKLCEDRPEIAGINGKHVHIIDDLLWKGAYASAEHRRGLSAQFLRPLQDFGHCLLQHIFGGPQAAQELTCNGSRDAHIGSSLSEWVHRRLGLIFRGRWRRHWQPHPRGQHGARLNCSRHVRPSPSQKPNIGICAILHCLVQCEPGLLWARGVARRRDVALQLLRVGLIHVRTGQDKCRSHAQEALFCGQVEWHAPTERTLQAQ